MSKYLKKKGHKGGMGNDRAILPHQGQQGAMPTSGVSNSGMENLNNTKAQVRTSVPQGKAHAKVMGNTGMKTGKYL